MKEIITRSFEGVRNIFPIEPRTFDDLAQTIEREGCSSVYAQCFTDAHKANYPSFAGPHLRFLEPSIKDSLYIFSVTPRLRQVAYHEDYDNILKTPRYSSEDAHKLYLRILLTANARLRELKRRFPRLEINMVGPYGIQMTPELWSITFEDAKGLAPLPKPVFKDRWSFLFAR